MSGGSGADAGTSGSAQPVEHHVVVEHRHVWVAPVPDGDGAEHAGLLHRWRWLAAPGVAGQWWALVTYLVDDEGQIDPVQVTSWVPAALVRKAS